MEARAGGPRGAVGDEHERALAHVGDAHVRGERQAKMRCGLALEGLQAAGAAHQVPEGAAAEETGGAAPVGGPAVAGHCLLRSLGGAGPA